MGVHDKINQYKAYTALDSNCAIELNSIALYYCTILYCTVLYSPIALDSIT